MRKGNLIAILILAGLSSFAQNVGIGTSAPNAKLTIVDDANQPLRIYEYSTVDGVNIRGFRARGTEGSPTAVLADDGIARYSAFGYTGAAFAGAKAQISMVAAQDWTSTKNGTYLTFHTTSKDSTTLRERVRVLDNGFVGIGTATPLGNVHIYTTNGGVVTGASGALVVENSLASTFTKGIWLKNTGGGGAGVMGIDIVGETFNGHTGAAPATIRFVDQNFATDITFRVKTGQGGANANNADVEVMRISSLAGNVGIGTTTPGATLNVIHPTSNTTPTKPTGTWAAIIENNQDADDGRHGLSVATRWGSPSSKIFEAASYWTGGAQAYTPALTVFGDRTVRVQNLAGTGNRPVYVDANGTLTATASHSGSGYRLFDMISYNTQEGYVRVNITATGVLTIVSRDESSGNVITQYTLNNVASAKVVLLITNDDTGGSGSQISGQRSVTRTNNNSHPTNINANDINTDLGKGGSDGHLQTLFIMYNPL